MYLYITEETDWPTGLLTGISTHSSNGWIKEFEILQGSLWSLGIRSERIFRISGNAIITFISSQQKVYLGLIIKK